MYGSFTLISTVVSREINFKGPAKLSENIFTELKFNTLG